MADERTEGGKAREFAPGVTLQDGERILWTGRPGFGVPRAERRRLFTSTITVMGTGYVLTLAYLAITAGSALESLRGLAAIVVLAFFLSVVPTAVIGLSMYLAKLTQASTASLAVLVVCGPLMFCVWGAIVQEVGLSRAVQTPARHPALPCLVVLGLPLIPALIHLVRRVLIQRHTHYFLTNRRFVEVRDVRGRPHAVAVRLLPTGPLQVRAIPLGDGERGHVAIGTGLRRTLLRLVDHPALVVEEIRRERNRDA